MPGEDLSVTSCHSETSCITLRVRPITFGLGLVLVAADWVGTIFMNIDLNGRTALVSGSTKGIGRAIAAGLSRAGASVVVNGRSADQVAATVRDLAGDRGEVTGVAADLATAEGAARLFEEVPDVDILVNNLGIFGPRPVLEIDDEEWRRYFEVNVLSGVRLTRQYLPGMTERGWGRVQFIASDSAVVIPAEMVHYGMTKTALLAVSRGYAKAAAGTGVTVNTVIAGPTHTEGVEDFVAELVGDDLPWEEAQRRFMAEHRPNSLIQRLIEPEEIANMVVYLASDHASATTGGALRTDGGYVDAILP
jgi:NAD(P)-dependent dehydrogenase (short-subunit alcohol dehydrogenase family)